MGEPSPAATHAPAPLSPAVRPGHLLRGLAPAAGVVLAGASAILLLAPALWTPSAHLVALYVLTPVAKEAWLVASETILGMPVLAAALLLLLVNVAVCLAALQAPPLDALLKRFPRLARRALLLRARLGATPARRGGVAAALAIALALPIHSGGAILGTLAGRSLGIPKVLVFAAVVGAAAFRLGLALAAMGGWALFVGA